MGPRTKNPGAPDLANRTKPNGGLWCKHNISNQETVEKGEDQISFWTLAGHPTEKLPLRREGEHSPPVYEHKGSPENIADPAMPASRQRK